jgi:hypothetical protein
VRNPGKVEVEWWHWQVAGGTKMKVVALANRWWHWNIAGGTGKSLVALFGSKAVFFNPKFVNFGSEYGALRHEK